MMKEVKEMDFEEKLIFLMNTGEKVQIFVEEYFTPYGYLKEVCKDFISIDQDEEINNSYVSIPFTAIKYVRILRK